MHRFSFRRSKTQSTDRRPPTNATAGNELDVRPASRRCDFRQQHVHALRSSARRTALREGRLVAARTGTLHGFVRHQKSSGSHAFVARRLARRFFRYSQRRRQLGVSQSNVNGQHQTEPANMRANRNKIPRTTNDEILNRFIRKLQKLRR